MSDLKVCIVCFRDLAPTERQTCGRCLAICRRSLARVEQLYALLPSMMSNLGAASALDSVLARGGDDATLPGGDLLVLLGPGSTSHVGHPSDPPAVAFELRQWCEDWAEIRREAVGGNRRVPFVVDWLSTRAGWAADHHPAFDEFVSDLRRIMVRLEDATGTSDRPETGPPCPYCGVSLLREWTDRGLADDWECGRCKRAFNPPQYRLAVIATLYGGQEAG